MADVVEEIEVVVVDPGGMALQRDVRQPLAVTRNQVQPRRDVCADALHVEPPGRSLQGCRVEQEGRGHVHVAIGVLQVEKRCVECRQPLVVAWHDGASTLTRVPDVLGAEGVANEWAGDAIRVSPIPSSARASRDQYTSRAA